MRRITTLAILAVTPLFAVSAAADSQFVGSPYFEVQVEDAAGSDGIGTFAVRTGTDHPAGAGLPVLFSGNDGAGTSFMTVRSYTTGTDYVQTTAGSGSGFLVSSLDAFGSVESLGSTGFRTTYPLPGGALTPDALRIVSEIEVVDTGESSSRVELRTSITNEGSIPTAIGVRFLLDFANGGDDGPALDDSGSAQIFETASIGHGQVTLAPTSSSAAPVSISVGGLDAWAFASWVHAFPFAFDYSPAGRNVAGPCGIDDSALLTYAGQTRDTALLLNQGDTVSFSVVLSMASGAGVQADEENACATPMAAVVPSPAQPTAAPAPAELPRTGGPGRSH